MWMWHCHNIWFYVGIVYCLNIFKLIEYWKECLVIWGRCSLYNMIKCFFVDNLVKYVWYVWDIKELKMFKIKCVWFEWIYFKWVMLYIFVVKSLNISIKSN